TPYMSGTVFVPAPNDTAKSAGTLTARRLCKSGNREASSSCHGSGKPAHCPNRSTEPPGLRKRPTATKSAGSVATGTGSSAGAEEAGPAVADDVVSGVCAGGVLLHALSESGNTTAKQEDNDQEWVSRITARRYRRPSLGTIPKRPGHGQNEKVPVRTETFL